MHSLRSRVHDAQACVHNGGHEHGNIHAYTLDDTHPDSHGGTLDDDA